MNSLEAFRANERPDFANVTEAPDPIALMFVVNDAKNVEHDEQAVFTAAINAMVNLLQLEDTAVVEAVKTWTSGRIRKLVKRARNKAWDDLAEIPEFAAEAVSGQEQVRVFIPKPVSTFAPQLQKLQVTGLSMPRNATAASFSNALVIHINDALEMSTGKLVAQVCHAVQLFLMLAPQDRVDAWLVNRYVDFNYVSDMSTVTADVIEVHDAGYTEIAANSYTTAADYSNV